MRTIAVLYDRLMRLRVPCAKARQICDEAVRQIHESAHEEKCDADELPASGKLTHLGRFVVEAHGGWIFGWLTENGVTLGGPRCSN